MSLCAKESQFHEKCVILQLEKTFNKLTGSFYKVQSPHNSSADQQDNSIINLAVLKNPKRQNFVHPFIAFLSIKKSCTINNGLNTEEFTKRVGVISSKLFVTLYTLSIYASAHKQLRRHLQNSFREFPFLCSEVFQNVLMCCTPT